MANLALFTFYIIALAPLIDVTDKERKFIFNFLHLLLGFFVLKTYHKMRYRQPSLFTVSVFAVLAIRGFKNGGYCGKTALFSQF
jgi:hypothetical protein